MRAPNTAAFLPFQPETAYSYEVGFKGAVLRSHRVRLNVGGLSEHRREATSSARRLISRHRPSRSATVPATATDLEQRLARRASSGIEGRADGGCRSPGFRARRNRALVADPKYVRFADRLSAADRSQERFAGVAKSAVLALRADYATGNRVIGRAQAWPARRLRLAHQQCRPAEYNWPSNPANPTGATSLPGILIVNPAATGGTAGAVSTQNQAVIDATTVNALGLVNARASVEFGNLRDRRVRPEPRQQAATIVQNLLVAPLGYITGIRNEPTTYGSHRHGQVLILTGRTISRRQGGEGRAGRPSPFPF